jgi:hypothetical protein
MSLSEERVNRFVVLLKAYCNFGMFSITFERKKKTNKTTPTLTVG